MADDHNTPSPATYVPWALQSTVERYHVEDGQWKNQYGDLVKKHTWEIDQIRERLNTGAGSFTKMDIRIKSIEDAKNPTWKTVLTIGLIIAPWIWVVAQYPTGEKFDMLQEKVRSMEMQQVKRDATIDAKLDLLLSRHVPQVP
jgi:hypothetical protein